MSGSTLQKFYDLLLRLVEATEEISCTLKKERADRLKSWK